MTSFSDQTKVLIMVLVFTSGMIFGAFLYAPHVTQQHNEKTVDNTISADYCDFDGHSPDIVMMNYTIEIDGNAIGNLSVVNNSRVEYNLLPEYQDLIFGIEAQDFNVSNWSNPSFQYNYDLNVCIAQFIGPGDDGWQTAVVDPQTELMVYLNWAVGDQSSGYIVIELILQVAVEGGSYQ